MRDVIAKPAKPFTMAGDVTFMPMFIGAQARCSNPHCSIKRGEWRPFDEFGFRLVDKKSLRNQPQCTQCRFKRGSNYGKSSARRKQSYSRRLTVGGLWLSAVFHDVAVWCPGTGRRGHWTRGFEMEVIEQEARQADLFGDAVEITVRNTTTCKRCNEGKRNDTFQPKR